MRVKMQCVIRYDTLRQCWAVHVGISLVHFGTLFSCEEWARMNAMPVRNSEELYRIKYNNMPTWEGLA